MPKAHAAHPEARLNRRKWDHDAGFAAWCDGASHAQIAAAEGVAEVSVKRAAVRERWSERRHEIEERARREADKRAVKSVERRIADNLGLIDASKHAYARGLQSGKVTVSASEMAALMKVEQLLTGGRGPPGR